MEKIAILGANNQIAHLVEQNLENLVDMKLVVRDDTNSIPIEHADVITLNVLDTDKLTEVLQGQDLIYASLSIDNMSDMAQSVLTAAQKNNIKRLIWVATPGVSNAFNSADRIQNEENFGNAEDASSFAGTEARAIKMIWENPIDSTIICPHTLTDNNSIQNYTVIDASQNIDKPILPVSRQTVAHFISGIILNPNLYENATISIGNTKR